MSETNFLGQVGSRPASQAVDGGVRTVPFDYVLTFDLRDDPGRVTTRVLNISPVGTFSVTAIGYGLLVDERVTPRRFGPVDPDNAVERPPNIPIPAVVLPPPGAVPGAAPEIVDPENGGSENGAPENGESETDDVPDDPSRAVKVLGAPGATVRASINGRPVPGGGTPTIQLDEDGRALIAPNSLALDGFGTLIVEDLTNGVQSRPIYLVGDKVALESAPTFGLLLPASGANAFDVVGVPGSQADVRIVRPGADRVPRFRGIITIPEDGPEPGVARVRIVDLNNGAKSKGAPSQSRQELEEARIAFRLRAGDVVTASAPGSGEDPIAFLAPSSITIPGTNSLQLSSIPVSALRSGFRLSRTLLDRLLTGVTPPIEELETPFVRCGSGCGDLNFLYSITDNATGRAFQNEPVHNIAGLGIADGDRPFRTLAHPIVFEPRSAIVFQVQEISGGPGTLYVVLQGYKVVGAGRQRFGFEG